MTGVLSRLAGVLSAACLLAVLGAAPAAAHPLGNFTTNSYAAVVVEPSAVRIDVVVDRAEVPTRQVFPRLDDRTGALPGGTDREIQAQCQAVQQAVALTADGKPLALRTATGRLEFPPGSAGLRTARLTCALRTADDVDLLGATLTASLAPVTGGPGWREVTAIGDGVRLAGSNVPTESVSAALREYPDDLLDAPLDVRSASFQVRPGTGLATGVGSLLEDGPVSAQPRGVDRFTEAFTSLVARDRITVPFAALALGAAVLLGALHAFAPGHGKTVMAAYLVGQRGALRDAAVVGLSVTATHTLGVLVLGVVLTAVGAASPATLYPWLTAASGLLLLAIGVALLRTARNRTLLTPAAAVPARVPVLAGRTPAPPSSPGTHDHDHDDHHQHHQHDHHHTGGHDGEDGHQHGHAAVGHAVEVGRHSHGLFSHTHAVPAPSSGVRGLLAVGFAGGMVPSPSALLVLLGGVALGRAWFGLVLVVAYGVGMAVALMLTGLLLVRAREWIVALSERGQRSASARWAVATAHWLPVATAGLVMLGGAVLVLRSIPSL